MNLASRKYAFCNKHEKNRQISEWKGTKVAPEEKKEEEEELGWESPCIYRADTGLGRADIGE